MPLDTVAEAKQFLARMVKIVLKGDIDTKTAYCINSIVNTFLRAQDADLEERLCRIENHLKAKRTKL
jgi:hypothetical protein